MHQLCITALLPIHAPTCFRYEACAVAGLWLGPELVCGAALRLNFPPTSCAVLGRAPPADVAAALAAGRWRPQLQVRWGTRVWRPAECRHGMMAAGT